MSEQDQTVDIEAARERRNARRSFLGTLGAVGAGAVLSGGLPAFAQARPNLDATILNFALNLEYLEAAFYAAAVGRLPQLRGLGGDAQIILPAGFDGTSVIPGLSSDVRAYAEEIAEDELAHVRFLRTALGGAAVARPVLDLGPAFLAAGSAASGGAITGFNPFANELFFLHGAYIFEDVGVTAYKGAAKYITNPDYLEAAAGILAAEAYHSGEIRTLLWQQRNTVAVAGLTVAQITQAISDLRDKVDGATDVDQGLLPGGPGNPESGGAAANIVLTDRNGIAYSRTPRQVANIVFLGGTTSGGFYPQGLSGNYSAILAL